MEKSENNGDFRFFRGNLTELGALNDPGFKLSDLTEKIAGLPGEPNKLIFKVRSQLTWFRMKHPAGRIATEVKNHDEFSAWIEASVYDTEGHLLQTANATATADRDAVHGLPLIETAESRAVSRALDFAGFGCQLDIGTFDESQDPKDRSPGSAPSETNNGETAENPQYGLKREPDTINPRMKVPADSGAAPVDISSLEKEAPKKRKGKAEAANDDKQADSNIPSDDTGNSDGEAQSKAPDTRPETEIIQTPLPDNKTDNGAGGTGDGTEGTGGKGITSPTREEETPPETAGTASVEDKVNNYISIRSSGPIEHFDKRFFENGTADPEAFYINSSRKVTGISNKDLQCAIAYITANMEMCGQIVCPLKETSPYCGKTFSELEALGDEGMSVIAMFATGYMKNNTPAFAAALIINHSVTEDKKGSK